MKKITLSFLILYLFSPVLSAQSAPGGVSSGLNYWLKADVGVTLTNGRVSRWDNQAASAGSISQSSDARQPNLRVNALNFNPGISFNVASNDFDFLNTDELVWNSETVILVFNPNQASANSGTLQAVLVYNIPNNRFGDAGIGIGSISNSSSDNFFNSTDITPAQSGEYIATSRVSPNNTNDPILAVVRQDTRLTPIRSRHRFWGEETSVNIINLNQYAAHQNTEFTIGQRDGGGLPFDGDVLEAISYSLRLDETSLRKIESYLAIKYGLTLNQSGKKNYIDSSENTIYDSEGLLSDFGFNIAGIGRDDRSGLNQKQSLSSTTNSVQANTNGIVTIALGAMAPSNVLNANSFVNDQTFLLWGNNAGSTSFDTSLTVSSNELNRMQRVWAVQKTGNLDAVQISIPKSIFDDGLIPSLAISSDATFDTVDKVMTLEDGGNDHYQTTVNISNGDFFTFTQSENELSAQPNFFITPLPGGDAVIYGL